LRGQSAAQAVSDHHREPSTPSAYVHASPQITWSRSARLITPYSAGTALAREQRRDEREAAHRSAKRYEALSQSRGCSMCRIRSPAALSRARRFRQGGQSSHQRRKLRVAPAIPGLLSIDKISTPGRYAPRDSRPMLSVHGRTSSSPPVACLSRLVPHSVTTTATWSSSSALPKPWSAP